MLSDTKIKAAKATGKPYKLTDGEGLYLYVSAAGARSWRFDYRLAGIRETVTIGTYPEVSAELARHGTIRGRPVKGFLSHDEARAMVGRDESPAKFKQAQKAEQRMARANTLRAAAEAWYAAKASARSESWRENARRWLDQDIYPQIGEKPIKEVSSDDVERLVKVISDKRGAKSSRQARLTLAGVFKSLPKALGLGNPARDVADVDMPDPTPRGRPLTQKEIPAFLGAVDRYPGRTSTKLAIKLLMLTFVRKRELIEATWSELDLEGAQWVIPAERMKMKKPHIVPLSRQAIECFRKLHELACGSKYVFPNLGSQNKPMGASTVNKVFDEIGYGGGRFTPHGARSTASTMLNQHGWSADAIERQLAHTERDVVRAAYNHADFMEERTRMMQAWADYLDGLSAGANVTPIRKAAA